MNSEKYSDKIYLSSGDDYLPYECVGLCYKTDCSQSKYFYNTVLAAKIDVTLSYIKELNPKWLESYYLTDKNEIVFVTQTKITQTHVRSQKYGNQEYVSLCEERIVYIYIFMELTQ